MPAVLTPRLALAYLRELSADDRAGAILDEHDGLLAGPAALAGAAAAVVAALGEAEEGQARLAAGTVLAVRRGRLAVVLACGPHAVPGLARHDAALVLHDLGAGWGRSVTGQVARLPDEVAQGLLSAAQSGAAGGSEPSDSRNLRPSIRRAVSGVRRPC
jgi:hypothetical protein